MFRLLIIILFLFSSSVFSTIINVPADQPTIQTGIDVAGEGDTVLVAAGTYKGEGNRNIDFYGKNLVVISSDGPKNTIIDVEGTVSDPARGFVIHSGETSDAMISGFTITDGMPYHESMYPNMGGAIVISNSSPTIMNNIIKYNSGGEKRGGESKGAGIYCENSYSIITDNTIERNHANQGGGIYCVNSDLEITNNKISDNDGHPGMFLSGYGGGIYCLDSNPTVENNVISNNSSKDPMGGYSSAGIGCYGNSYVIIRFNVMFGNSGTTVDATKAEIMNNTIVDTYTSIYISEPDSSIIIKNNILATMYVSDKFFKLPLESNDIYNVINRNQFINELDSLIGSFGNFSADPLFCDTANGNFQINSPSPCAPDNSPYGELVGAFGVGCGTHAGPVWHVAKTGNDTLGIGDGSETNPFATIQRGVDAASEGDTVLVADGNYGGMKFEGKNLVVVSMNGPEVTTIGGSRLLSGVDTTTVISGFTIRSTVRLINSSPIIENNIFKNSGRRGLYTKNSSAIIRNNYFLSNSTEGYGGAIYSDSSSLKISQTVFANNVAKRITFTWWNTYGIPHTEYFSSHGGAIFLKNENNLTVSNSTFVNNKAQKVINSESGDYVVVGNAIYGQGSGLRTINLYNNIFYSTKDQTFSAQSISGISQNSIIFCNDFESFYISGYSEAQLLENNNFSSDPLFCDVSNGDYHITSTSLCALNNSPCGELVGAFGVGCEPQYQSVYIDIKPGSCPNPLNMKRNNSKAVLPTAILGTEDFDVHDIDPASITMLGVSPVRWSYEDVGTPFEGEECECSEDGPDGYIDLTLKFDRNNLLDTLMRLPFESDMQLTVLGMMNDETELKGSDCVRLLKNGRMPEAVELDGDIIPLEITLVGNNPNPFNPTTTISYGLPSHQKVTIEIFNMLGQKVTTLVDKHMLAGYHTVEWDASNIASGIYLYRLTTNDYTETKKMILLK